MTAVLDSAAEPAEPADGHRTPFVPAPPPARYAPPAATVDPDRSLSWVRRMMPIMKAHQGVVVSGLVCALLMLLLQIGTPWLIKQAIDKTLVPIAAGHVGKPLAPWVAALVVIAVLRFGLGYVYRLNLQRTSFVIEYDLRVAMYEQFGRLSFSYFDAVQSGQLISRANSDIRSVQMFLAFAPVMAVSFIGFFAAFALMATINLPLALVAVVTMPLVYFSGVKMRNVMFPVSWIVQARMADVATIVEENVTGTRVVKSFAGERQQIRLLDDAAEKLRWANNVMVDVRARWSPVLQNLPRLGFVLVLLYGGVQAIHHPHQVTVGTLIAFSQYIVMLAGPFTMLGFLMMLAERARASAGRIFEILDEQPAIADRPGAVDLVNAQGDVRFDSVTFGYGESAPILQGLDLHLAAGETVALVGRTGSGKSTIARLLPRFYDVRSGAVLIDGYDVRDLTVDSLRAYIGLVLDEPFLFSETIRANIAYGRPDAPQHEIEEAARSAGAAEFIDKLPEGYDTMIGERGYTLSGGQRQRIAIARTLLVNPRVLILDDATSAIDVQVELEIHDALRILMQGRTTLIIAHRLSTISLADRVVLLQGGHITATGTHTELMRTTPAYAEVLARAEEEYVEAHKPPADADDSPVTDARPAADGRPPVVPPMPGSGVIQ